MDRLAEAPERPKRMVKYFDPKYQADIENGRFRIGTTLGYRAHEGMLPKQGTLSDLAEGDHIFDMNTRSSKVDLFRIPFMTIIDSWPPNIEAKFNMPQNDYIFCATMGEYDQSHHVSMVEGIEVDGKKIYDGNSSYTAFAIIDVAAFEYALTNQIAFLASIGRAKPDLPPYVITSPVRYGIEGKTIKIHGRYPKFYDYTLDAREHYLSSAFTKPARFAIERELRMVAQIYTFGKAPKETSAIFTNGRGFQKAIVELGKL